MYQQPRKVSSAASVGVKGETRKRPHSLGSSVGAVVKHDIDDGYDPYRPAIGNVASIVKVTERK